MKNPLIVDKVILSGLSGSGIYGSDGTTIVDENYNIDAPVTTSNLTTTGNTTLGDTSADALSVPSTSGFTAPVTISSTLSTQGKVSLYKIGSAAESASGLLMGVGTSLAPATTATAGANFVELRTQSTATSGDNRCLYMRHELAGAAGGGETLRALTKLSAAVGTARGAHISLDVNTTGSLTGLGCGVDAQIAVPNQALGAGAYAVVNSEIYSAGSSSSVAASNIAFFRATASGDATGAATVDTAGNLFSIQGLTVGSGKLFQVNTAGAASHALRIKIGETPYYIMLTDTGA